MADKKISELSAIPSLDVADVLPIVDASDSTTKKVSMSQFDARWASAALANGKFYVGNGSGVATAVSPTGDVTFDNTGLFAIGANKVLDTMIRQSAGLSVLGRSANSSGNIADITAGSDFQVLRRSGTSLAFGTVDTGGITNSAITYAKIQNISATNRILGRSTAGAGVVEEITVGGDLTQSGSNFTIANGVVTLAKIQNAAANSKLIGAGAAGIGAPYVEITLGTNLSMSGTTLNATGGGGIGGSTGATDNRVLRADGTGGSTLQNSGVTIDDNGFMQISVATEQGLEVISTLGAGAGNNLFLVQNNNVLWDRPLMRSNDNTSNGGAANLRCDSPNPDIEFVETDQVSPAGKFEIAVNSDKIQFNGRDAVDSQFEPSMTGTRYGKSGAEARWLIGGLYDNANAHLEIVSVNSSDYFMLSTAVGGTSGNVLKVTSTGAFTFNTGAAARNFNLRSVNDANMFLMDATNDRIGIRHGTPTSTWHLVGSLGIGFVTKTGNYTLTATDYGVNVTSGTNTQTLPTAVGINHRKYVVVNSGTGIVTVATTSSQTINGVTTRLLGPGDFVEVVSDNANWKVVSSSPYYQQAYLGTIGNPNSVSTVAQNNVYLIDVNVTATCTVTGIAYVVGTSNGNVDVGLYDSAGNRLASSGSVACPAAGKAKTNFSASVTIAPGFYKLAIASNSATATFARNGTEGVIGVNTIATSFPLPSTLTMPGTQSSVSIALVGVVSGGTTQ